MCWPKIGPPRGSGALTAPWPTAAGATTTPSPRRPLLCRPQGQGLQCQGEPAVVPDSPELRPAPGLRIECWAKLDALGTSWQPLLIKDGAYQLRLDPPQEGGRLLLLPATWVDGSRGCDPGRPPSWASGITWSQAGTERRSGSRSTASGPAAPRTGSPLAVGRTAGAGTVRRRARRGADREPGRPALRRRPVALRGRSPRLLRARPRPLRGATPSSCPSKGARP